MLGRTVKLLILAWFAGASLTSPVSGLEFCTIGESFQCASIVDSCCAQSAENASDCCTSTPQEKECCIEMPAPGDKYTAPANAGLEGPKLLSTIDLPSDFLSQPVWNGVERDAFALSPAPPPGKRSAVLSLHQSLLL